MFTRFIRALSLVVAVFLVLVCAQGEASTQRPGGRAIAGSYPARHVIAEAAYSKSGNNPGKGHVVSFGMSDDLDVFRKEATRGAAVLSRHFGRGGQVVVRANTPAAAQASIRSFQSTLMGVSNNMDRENDILFVFLTSHGSTEGVSVKTGENASTLSPRRLKSLLRQTGARNKVVIISACFSGVFAEALADRRTLVITAADATHPSFGCEPTAEWTWFGEALFVKGIPNAPTLQAAFARARSDIRKKEDSSCRRAKQRNEKCDEPSNPQIRGGEDILPLLRSAAQAS
jgi:Peptidase C13 family